MNGADVLPGGGGEPHSLSSSLASAVAIMRNAMQPSAVLPMLPMDWMTAPVPGMAHQDGSEMADGPIAGGIYDNSNRRQVQLQTPATVNYSRGGSRLRNTSDVGLGSSFNETDVGMLWKQEQHHLLPGPVTTGAAFARQDQTTDSGG